MQLMNNILLFSLIIMRISGFILFNPIFGRRNIPNIIKAGIILLMSFIIISYQFNETVIVDTVIEYSLLLVKEFFCGFAIGTVVNLFLYIIILGGEIIDFQMGTSMSKVFDVQSNSSLALSSTFFNILFVLLFFSSDAHLILIRIFLNSNEIVPYGNISINQELSSAILTVFRDCTVLAVKLSMPIMAAEMIGEIGVGILMKTIPQINVFVVNIQTKILVGLILLILLFSPMSQFIENCIELMFKSIQDILIFMK